MKRSSLVVALALSSLASAALQPLAAADETLKTEAVKQIRVQSAAEVKRAFGFAANDGRQAIEITCSPASSTWCSKDFVTACDNADGVLSSSPDGGKEGSVVCSLPQHE